MNSIIEKGVAEAAIQKLTDEQVTALITNIAPVHPALRRLHEKLNTSDGAEAAITSYDRMHHRHNRS